MRGRRATVTATAALICYEGSAAPLLDLYRELLQLQAWGGHEHEHHRRDGWGTRRGRRPGDTSGASACGVRATARRRPWQGRPTDQTAPNVGRHAMVKYAANEGGRGRGGGEGGARGAPVGSALPAPPLTGGDGGDAMGCRGGCRRSSHTARDTGRAIWREGRSGGGWVMCGGVPGMGGGGIAPCMPQRPQL